MGMDAVELVLEVERSFGITLDDASCAHVRTVGDLCDLVRSLVPRAEQERCLSALAFYRLRAALVSLGRARARPSTALEELVWEGETHVDARRETWARLERTLGLDLPPLERTSALVATCATLCAGALVAMLFSGRPELAVFVAIGLAVLLAFATRRARASLPYGLVTAGGLAQRIVRHQAAKVAAPAGGFTPAQVEAIVTRIVATFLSLPLERVTLDARFKADMGLD